MPPDRPGAALVRALVLGDAGGLPLPWVQGLRRAGLAHVTAVSGLHVGLIGAAVFLLAAAAPRPMRLLLALLAVVGYLALVGPRPSALRAAAMIALAVASLALERPPQGGNALAACAALLLLADPLLIVDLGFRLSFAATAAILFLSPALATRWTLLPRSLRLPLAVTVAAQLATLPFTIPAFALVAPAAPVANLLATPWLAATLLASFLWALLALASPAAAAKLLPAVELLARPLDGLAALPPGPLLALPVAASPAMASTLAAGALVVLLWPRWGVALTLVPLLLTQGHGARHDDPELTLLDVGQGEAILIRDGRRALLIDGGGWPAGDFGGRVLVPALAARGIRRLDAVVLTHSDADHCRGLVDLARYLPVGEARASPGWPPESCAGELLAAPGIRPRPLRMGDRLALGRWRLTVLHPPAETERLTTNDRSLVLLAAVHGRRLLLTGDVEAGVERRLARAAGDAALAADVLKLAHHGSKTSTDRLFLRAVAPRLALISAGRHNRYGHPAAVVLERLENAGVRVLRTDRGGAVELRIPPSGAILLRRPGGG